MPSQDRPVQTLSCTLDPARAAALHVTLGRMGAVPRHGDALPPFWHQIYFWDAQPPDRLGRDGHPATGSGLIPDLGLPQRMWAGGRLQFLAPVRLGEPAKKVSTIVNIAEKDGRSGRLGFVTLRHEISQGECLCITEEQDLVYRAPPQARASRPPPMAATDETARRSVRFDSTLLFRYSALTFNGHRIHYDADYARDVEGYPGLVPHGPLLAQYLIDFATDELGPLAAFSFRATAPLDLGDTAELCILGRTLWVRGPDGRQAMRAEAEPVGAA